MKNLAFNKVQGIDGMDWQTNHNSSTYAPSYRENTTMAKVADSFYNDELNTVDAVFAEGYLRGLNHALHMMQAELMKPTSTYKKAFKDAARDIELKREYLLSEHNVDIMDDDALITTTPILEQLMKEGE